MIGAISRWSPRRRLVVIAAVVLAALIAAIILTLTESSPTKRTTSGRGAPALHAVSTRTSAPPMNPTSRASQAPAVALPPLVRTDDPVAYAREVADALLDVDPATITRAEFLQFWRGELPTVVYSDGAAKGLTLAQQNADAISNLTQAWIPPQDAWRSEAEERTTNHITITSVSVPDYWVDAVAEGTFRDPGLHMERVMGVLHQSYGTDPADRHTSDRSVVIDLGLLCGPTQPGGCRLLAPQLPPGLGDS